MTDLPWELRVHPDKASRTTDNVQWSVQAKTESQGVYLVQPVSTLQELETDIDRLAQGLQALKQQAREIWAGLETQEQKAGEPEEVLDPAEVWARLAASSSQEEMLSMFNGLPEEVRKKTAEYVFSAVNMFNGPGAFFAQNYEQTSALLELEMG